MTTLRNVAYLMISIVQLLSGAASTAQNRSANEIPLFLIGDSISLQYTPYLKEDLAPRVAFSRKEGTVHASNLDVPDDANGGNSNMVLSYLEKRYKDKTFAPAILLVNAGLHDVKRDVHTNQLAVPPEIYRRNLMRIASLALKHHATLIWVNTTPVDDIRHNRLSHDFHRFDSDVRTCNLIASAVFRAKAVPIIDLYEFTAKSATTHYIDHVHYDDAMRALQAAFIAGAVNALADALQLHTK
ncbi:SGNH/GDSL hydrolase family protein [Terriglobus albidus]|uniref:SGNH/GDSL hydrolase family protein n=1 Tax=Terriglobus albidus TaxID=1592106 RepID=UPI00164D6318|nr:SGNH/GDSL hydrolase family protein [Terriglobus albidus]